MILNPHGELYILTSSQEIPLEGKLKNIAHRKVEEKNPTTLSGFSWQYLAESHDNYW